MLTAPPKGTTYMEKYLLLKPTKSASVKKQNTFSSNGAFSHFRCIKLCTTIKQALVFMSRFTFSFWVFKVQL